jgi:3-oxoadipate enol-lactonase
MPQIELHATTLHVLDEGAGPVVLLLHGFPLDHRMWRHQVTALKQGGYRVVAPDLRGFGTSTIEAICAKTGVEMASYADDVRQMLDQMRIVEPVVLAGFSMGGYVALQFVSQWVDRVRALILCDTKATADAPAIQESRYNMAENVEGWGAGHVAQLMLPKLISSSTPEEHPEVVAELEAIIGRTNPVAIAAAQRGMAHRADSSPLLSRLEIPTLCLVGADDTITPPQVVHDMAGALPNASVVTIEHAGHVSPMENPERVNQAILAFLESLRP